MLSDILGAIGPCVSSKLAAEICARQGITAATARKRIERAKKAGEILAVPGIRFKHNEQFLYASMHERTGQLQAALFEALVHSKSNFKIPLLGLQARGGIIPTYLFPAISGFPLLSREHRQNATKALSHLLETGLLIKNELADSIELSDLFAPNIVSNARYRARLVAEQILLMAMKDWLRLQGFLGAEKCSLRNAQKAPQFGFYQWDLVAPSFISPISTRLVTGVQPGFIVADAILGRKLSLADVTPFIHKITAIRGNTRNRPFLAILVADWFDKEAFIEGRKQGLVFTTPKNLFGKSLSELLDYFVQGLENKQSFLLLKPDYMSHLANNLLALQHLTEAAGFATEHFFSLLVGACFVGESAVPPVYDVNLGSRHVIDLIYASNNKLIACVCIWRSEKTPVNDSDLAETIKNVSAIHSLFGVIHRPDVVLKICTNRTFTQSALKILDEKSELFPLSWVDGPALRKLISSRNLSIAPALLDEILD